MNKKILLFCLLILVLFVSGCDAVQDLVDFVDSLFGDFLPTLWCWILYLISGVVNAMSYIFSNVATPALSLLPEYTLPTIDLNSVPFLGYAAYFIPISEGATLVKYLLTFYVTFFVGRIVLRWLKVLR